MLRIKTAKFTTPVLTQRKYELLNDLIINFAKSVNFCIEQCLEHNVTSRAGLHRVAYEEWKKRFDLSTHWFHSASQVTTRLLRSWRKLSSKGAGDSSKPPCYDAKAMRLELWSKNNRAGICKFHGHAIQVRVREGKYLWLPLITTEYNERMYIQDWQAGKTKAGEISISLGPNSRANIHVPFKREVELKQAEGVCGIDINERSVDLCIMKLNQEPKHVKLDTSKLASIAHSMELKQKSIQEKLDSLPQRPIQKARLKWKYSKRRRNRTNQVLHVVSKEIAEVLSKERVEPVFEDLTNIRQSMRSKQKSENGKALRKDMRRRLNQWPFRKLQFYVEYKTLQQGYSTHYLPREQVKGTSSTCPMCGAKSKPNGHVFSCKACGLSADRHFVGAYNIAARWTKDVARNVPAEWRQMQPIAELVVPVEKLSAETQESPMQNLCGNLGRR